MYNAGLKTASNEYIGFTESDSRIEPNMHEGLYKKLKRQMLICVLVDFSGIKIIKDTKKKTLQKH
ncbi:hypothetical protein BA919_06850 [Helicobacter pullorum]|nr:hypothetical protein BA919_06850 [Helicobacter pullorum]